jgi:RND family efflux transporter MFP subunit
VQVAKASRKFVWLFIAGLSLAVLAGLTYRRLEAKRPAPKSVQKPALPVTVVPAREGPIQEWVYGEGTARALRREYLYFEASGRVAYVKPGPGGRELRPGDQVSKGELLAKLDDRAVRQQVSTAQAALDQARAQAQHALSSLDAARAQAQGAEAALERSRRLEEVAQADFQRHAELFRRQIEPRETYDTYRARLESARAEVKAAQARLKAARSQVEAAQAAWATAQAAVKAAEARLVQAQLDLQHTRIYSPMDGILAYLNIRPGYYFSRQFVDSSSETALLQTIPMVVIDPSEFEITLKVSASEGRLIRPGQAARVALTEELTRMRLRQGGTSALEAAWSIPATVFSVNPAVEPGARSTEVRLRTRQAASVLKDGSYVSAWIVTRAKERTTVIPLKALLFREGRPYVFVVDSRGVARRRAVELGLEGMEEVEVLRGVAPGDKLVIEGRHRLVDGARVSVISR